MVVSYGGLVYLVTLQVDASYANRITDYPDAQPTRHSYPVVQPEGHSESYLDRVQLGNPKAI